MAERVATNAARLEAIETRLAELHAMREASERSDAELEARMTRLDIERQSVERTTHEGVQVAAGLPTALLEDRGIKVTAIEALRERAHALGGHEVREIARSIAGEDAGDDRPREPPAEVGDVTDDPRTEVADRTDE